MFAFQRLLRLSTERWPGWVELERV